MLVVFRYLFYLCVLLILVVLLCFFWFLVMVGNVVLFVDFMIDFGLL